MWKEATRPLFLLLFVCMWMTAATEMGPDQWFPRVMGALVPQLSPEAGSGVLFLVYTAGLMFVHPHVGQRRGAQVPARHADGQFRAGGHRPLLAGQPGYQYQRGCRATAATLFGIGKTFLWPTMIGVTAELFPRGGPLLLSLMGGAGMLSVGLVLPIMGAQMDKYGPGAALQMVAALGAILTVVFGGLWLRFQAAGGYRAVAISTVAGGK